MSAQLRNASLTMLLVAAALPVEILAGESGLTPRVDIRIFNYAGVSGGSFARAQKEAGRILQRTGIAATWIACAGGNDGVRNDPRCTAKTQKTDLVVRILPKEMDGFESPSVFGAAFIPRDGRFGKRASVFYTRVEEYAERWQAPEGVLLGHLIAHEVGHLLLGANSHTRSGIMSAPWNRDTIEKASLGTLLFTRQEALTMQRQVAARIAEGGGQKTAASAD